MLCYKEVHKYNGEYYSRYDNGYKFVIGEIAKPSEDDYIYATDTIENVLDYAYVPFDIAILEMEIVEGVEWKQRGYVITAKAVKVLREVSRDEYIKKDNRIRKELPERKGNPLLYDLLKERRNSILSEMQYGI